MDDYFDRVIARHTDEPFRKCIARWSMRAFNARQRNRRLQTSERVAASQPAYGLLKRKKRDYGGKANPIKSELPRIRSGHVILYSLEL